MKRSIISIAVLTLVLIAACSSDAKVRKHRGRRGESMAQVEAQVLRASDALSKFEKVIKTNPKTLDYNFKKLEEAKIVDIETSPDGNVRYYYWEIYDEIENEDAESNYVWPSEVKLYEQCRLASGKVVTREFKELGEKMCNPGEISELKAKDGTTAYVVKGLAPCTHTSYINYYWVGTIGKKGLELLPFTKKGKTSKILSREGYIGDLEEVELPIVDTKAGEINIAGDSDASGAVAAYDVYTLNGKELKYKKTVKN